MFSFNAAISESPPGEDGGGASPPFSPAFIGILRKSAILSPRITPNPPDATSAAMYAAYITVANIPEAPPVNGVAKPRAAINAVNPASIVAPTTARIKARLQSIPATISKTKPRTSPTKGIYLPNFLSKSGAALPSLPRTPGCSFNHANKASLPFLYKSPTTSPSFPTVFLYKPEAPSAIAPTVRAIPFPASTTPSVNFLALSTAPPANFLALSTAPPANFLALSAAPLIKSPTPPKIPPPFGFGLGVSGAPVTFGFPSGVVDLGLVSKSSPPPIKSPTKSRPGIPHARPPSPPRLLPPLPVVTLGLPPRLFLRPPGVSPVTSGPPLRPNTSLIRSLFLIGLPPEVVLVGLLLPPPPGPPGAPLLFLLKGLPRPPEKFNISIAANKVKSTTRLNPFLNFSRSCSLLNPKIQPNPLTKVL